MSKPLDGYSLARHFGIHAVIVSDKTDLQYCWRLRRMALPRSFAYATDGTSLALVAHEIAHALQPHWIFWLRIFQPVREWLERDANRKAIAIMESLIAGKQAATDLRPASSAKSYASRQRQASR